MRTRLNPHEGNKMAGSQEELYAALEIKRALTADYSLRCIPESISDTRYGSEDKLSFKAFHKDKTERQEWIPKVRRVPAKD